MQSENEAYSYLLKREKIIQGDLVIAMKANVLDSVRQLEKALNETIPRQRAQLLYTLNSSIDVVDRVIKSIQNVDSEAKIITFSERTTQADKITSNSYHAKRSDAENSKVLEAFGRGDIDVMSTCAKVNRGANIDNLKYAIFESYNRNPTALRQRNGRLMRLSPEEVGTIYILMPYYIKDGFAYPTRAVEWGRAIWRELKGVPVEVLKFSNYNIK